MECVAPKLIWPHRSIDWCDKNEEKPVSVPCGKCLACLSSKRQDWAFRIAQEKRFSNSSYFVTLTYDEKHLRTDRSLCKRDLQLYMKRLRKAHEVYKRDIRYFAVGEYGSKGGRPHYHMLLFNAERHLIERSWCDSKGKPIGIVHVGDVTDASIMYTLKYMVQPDVEVPYGFEPPFRLMSRKYGIGGRYLSDEIVEYHRRSGANYIVNGGAIGKLPRFYKVKIWYGEKLEQVNEQSRIRAIMEKERVRTLYEKKFGKDWAKKYAEFRDAELAQISIKVAFSQSM